MKGIRPLVVLAALCGALAVPVAAQGHGMTYNNFGSAMMPLGDFNTLTGGGFVATKNMHPMGFSSRAGYVPGSFGTFGSDLAFWGDKAYHGTWDGFRVLDISQPDNPVELVNYKGCAHPSGQGDVVVWNNILVRTWDANNATGSTRTCGGQPVPAGPSGGPAGTGGFEGLHIFDVSNPADPVLMSSVDLTCGSHTASGFPDVENNRFVVYSTPSSGTCPGIDVVSIPLDDPSTPTYHGFKRAQAVDQNGTSTSISCHDTGIIRGDANLAACAGGVGFAVWSIGGENGGSYLEPELQYVHRVGFGVTVGHSAAFSWDGDTLIFGHEPGGGSAARCQETGAPLNAAGTQLQTDDMKTLFFYDALSGELQGKHVLPRPQTADENCTMHNYNIVPTGKRDILVHGSYQSGIGVVDFTNRSDIKEIAYADPAPLPRLGTGGIQVAGDWSSYWYNGRIYEADIGRGLMGWNLSSNATAGAAKLPYLNPQTQEFTID